MHRSHSVLSGSVALGVLLGGLASVFAQDPEPRLFKKFSGRVPILGLRLDYPNPALLDPAAEDCSNGVDDDMDGTIDFRDVDCLSDLGPQNLFLKLPFKVVQPVSPFAAARFTGAKRSGDPFPLGELLINSSGSDGRKLSYLRTADPDIYDDVRVKALIIPGRSPDAGGPVAIRIQAAGTPKAHKSYYLKTVPGIRISIMKDQGDGTSVELAGSNLWDSQQAIFIPDYEIANPSLTPCYEVELSAEGTTLRAKVTEVYCHGADPTSNRFSPPPVVDRTLSLTATDDELARGYVGLRSDNDVGGGERPDDALSIQLDPSVLDYVVSDPRDDPVPGAPRILYFTAFSSNLDDLDYTTRPITATNDSTYHRSMTTVSDASLAAYLRSLGFRVDELPIASMEVGLITPEIINATYDLFWVPSSGGGASTRPFVGKIDIPLVFSEHVVGRTAMADGGAGLWAGTGNLNGNENKIACGTKVFTAVMNGANERPDPVDTPATGFGRFPYDEATRTLSYHIQYSGLKAPESNAHFHNAPEGQGGPVLIPLPPGNPKIGSVVLSESEAGLLLAGNVYVNIHSTAHGGGEIRGQLKPGTLSPTSMRVLPADKGGNPDHPLIRGLADEEGDILVHDINQLPLNVLYAFPGEGYAGLSGAGFKSPAQILFERGWGTGAPETQFAGYPPTQGGVALASTVDPCTGQPLWQVNAEGNLATADGRGHISLMAVEAGSPRLADDPANCPNPECNFKSRNVFYWLSDRQFTFATKSTLAILRRSALWALGLLDSPNRSDVPFKRGDANADGRMDLSDAVATLTYLFLGGGDPVPCFDAMDIDDDEKLNISDPIYSLSFQFLGGDRPLPVFNISFQGCGLDLTPERLPDEAQNPGQILSCRSYPSCRS